jgi:hypothetical protein
VLTSNLNVLVYNPNLDYHSSLVYQFQISGTPTATTFFFSSSSYLTDTLIVFGDDKAVNNYYLSTSPILEFIPGGYSNAYST